MTSPAGGDPPDGAVVRDLLAQLAARAPGRSVEVRVPPHGAVQIVSGPVHRRGTPKATVEMSGRTLADLAGGQLTWSQAVASGAVLASGERTDLSGLFPLDRPESPD
jgi:Bacterial SCP ortholog